MNTRYILAFFPLLILLSCTTVKANPNVTAESIEGFTDTQPMGDGGSKSIAKDPQEGRSLFARHHSLKVNGFTVTTDKTNFYSCSDDGFISRFSSSGYMDSWQISDIPVRLIAVHPEGRYIAAYESDGYSIYRVSLWDWETKTRVYAKRFKDSILSLSWSAKGSWLFIGNTSLEGLTILEGLSGKNAALFKNQPGIVSLAATGASEASVMTFGPSGKILYTDLTSGATRATYQAQMGVTNPVLFNNNRSIAGFAEGNLIVIDATSGKTISQTPVTQPLISISSDNSSVLRVESSETGWMITDSMGTSRPLTLPPGETPTSVLSLGPLLALGTAEGSVYYADESLTVTAATTERIRRIDDFASDNSRLFMLSNGALLISSGPGKSPVFAFEGITANRLLMSDDGFLLWSETDSAPLLYSSLDGDMKRTILETTDPITSLDRQENLIAVIEGSRKISVLSLSDGQKLFSYSGAGLQEAVLAGETHLLVSKSSTLNSPHALLYINITTGETVPVRAEADLCYGLTKTGMENNKLHVSGFFVKTGNGTSTTELTTITISVGTSGLSPVISKEASYGDEDLSAFVVGTDASFYTTLGKGALTEIGKNGAYQRRYERGPSVPVKITVMERFLVTLNADGSLSWFDRKEGSKPINSIVSDKRLWIEF